MGRIGISAVVLLLAVGTIGPTPAAPPVIKLALYAPPAFHQPDQGAPSVHIVGFENTSSEIRWVVSNTSDKTVASVIIKSEWGPPPGCATKPGRGELSENGGSRYRVSIAPHGTAVVYRDNQYPLRRLVDNARIWGTPYLQVQFGVTGVFFRDGTAWPTPVEDYYHTEFWDPKLLQSAARNCSGTANVEAAWDQVDISQIVFEEETSQATDPEPDHSAIPQLHFSCTLEGPKAICHMPLTNSKRAPDQPSSSAQRK